MTDQGALHKAHATLRRNFLATARRPERPGGQASPKLRSSTPVGVTVDRKPERSICTQGLAEELVAPLWEVTKQFCVGFEEHAILPFDPDALHQMIRDMNG